LSNQALVNSHYSGRTAGEEASALQADSKQ